MSNDNICELCRFAIFSGSRIFGLNFDDTGAHCDCVLRCANNIYSHVRVLSFVYSKYAGRSLFQRVHSFPFNLLVSSVLTCGRISRFIGASVFISKQ